jgi:hypothetical protein
MFVLNSEITLGSFRFTGVHDVRIKKSLHSIMETAVIEIPSIARIIRNGKALPETVVTAGQFKKGDEVIIKLGYDGKLETEFRGFVRSMDLNMPLSIECEGYSWLMRRNSITAFYKTISLKQLLTVAVSSTVDKSKIKVVCDVDMEFCNIHLEKISGFDLVTKILEFTDGAVTCFFVSPDTLWCGLIYSVHSGPKISPLSSAKYRLGYNTLKENSLRVRDTAADAVEVTFSKRLSNGTVISKTSDVFKNPVKQYKKTLNHVNKASALKLLANEKACRMCYSGYEGKFTAFLQPYTLPGSLVYISDNRFNENAGIYIIEGTELHYGKGGGRRIVEAGVRTGN